MKKLSIIIPVYNEEKTVGTIINNVISLALEEWSKEIIVVDDGSNDQTRKILKSFDKKIQLHRHKKNYGRGKALQTGISISSGSAIMTQDADLEYSPVDWVKMLSQLEDPGVQVVYGSRTINSKLRGYLPFALGARFLTFLTNALYGSHLSDLYTGYKLFRKKAVDGMTFKSSGFEFEAELTIQFLKKGVHIIEVPINYQPRTFKQGKKITLIDGFLGLHEILRNKFLLI